MSDTHHLIAIKDRWAALLPEARRIAKHTGALSRLVQKLTTDEAYESLSKLDKSLAKLTEINIDPGALAAEADGAAKAVRGWMDAEWSRRAGEFAVELREYFGARELDVQGQAPTLTILPFELRLEADKDRAQLFYAGEPASDRLPLSAPPLYKEWQTSKVNMDRDSVQPDAFVDQLIDAYRAVRALRTQEKDPSKPIRLPDLHFHLFARRQTSPARLDPVRKRIKEYPRGQFAWDLNGLLESGVGLSDRLVLLPASERAARSRGQSIAVVRQNGDREYYSGIQLQD